MKVQFKKNYLNYKADAVETIEDKDIAADLISKGIAVEVKEDAAVDSVVAEFEKKVTEVAERVANEAASKAVEKINKAFKRPSIHVGADNVETDPQRGFKSFGDYLMNVKNAATGEGEASARLKASGMSEAVSADGGFATPVQYANEVFSDLIAGDDLFGRTRKIPVDNGNIIKIPADNTNTIGGGVTASWISEGGTFSGQKPAGRQISLQPYKLGDLVYVTDELLTDSVSALQAYVSDKMQYGITYAVNNAIARGDGSSKPTGLIGYAATVSVPRNTVNTVKFADIANMRARFYGDVTKAVWAINQEVFAQLVTMTNGNYPVWLQGMTADGAPFSSILGIPVVVSEHMSSLGSAGDICLFDLSKYYTAYIGGLQQATSIHLKFDTQEVAYRWSMRVDGKPARSTVITPATGQGSNTLSPYVQLSATTT